MDAAGDAFQKGHDADLVAPLAEERERLGQIRLGANPPNQVSAAMESIARVTRPHGARPVIHPIEGSADGGDRQGREGEGRSLDADAIPEGVDPGLVLQGKRCGRSASPHAAPRHFRGDRSQGHDWCEHQGAPAGIVAIHDRNHLGRRVGHQTLDGVQLGDHVGRPMLENHPLGVVGAREGAASATGGQHQATIRSKATEPGDGIGGTGERQADDDHTLASEHLSKDVLVVGGVDHIRQTSWPSARRLPSLSWNHAAFS